MFPLLLLSQLLSGGGAADLASDDYAVREAASARLIRHGLFALPILHEAASSNDAEARWRAEAATAVVLRRYGADRLPLYWTAWRLIYEDGTYQGPERLDAWQTAEFKDGGARIYLAILDIADAAKLTGGVDHGQERRSIEGGNYTPWDALRIVERLRLEARGLDDGAP
jgi:hypothetical protein